MGKQEDRICKFCEEQDKIKSQIDSLLEDYEEFTKKVSPKNWRSTGSHFTNLREMKKDVDNYSAITEEEKERVKIWLEPTDEEN
jgi:peptidoglycan hydrolase CwlO-like protein